MKKITFLLMLIGFSLTSFAQVSLCQDAVSVTLPFTSTDDTANYADTNYEGSPGATGCGTTNAYLGGNDVVYAYTATSDTSIKLEMITTGTWSGMFVYTSCASIGTGCVGGGTNTGAGGVTIPSFTVTTGQTYYIVISSWPAPQTIAYTLNITENTCTNATATYSVVSNCSIAPEFFVDVNLTSLGSAFTLTLSDNQGSPNQFGFTPGIIQFGPYANGTSVVITTTNDQDATCVLTSPAQTQAVCPPTNTLCANAIDLTNLTSPVTSTTVGATNNFTPSCDATGTRPDVFYSIFVPSGSTLTMSETNTYDSVVSVFYGDCVNQTEITCFDDPDETVVTWANNTGSDQTVYWVQDGYGTTSAGGTFTLSWSVIACTNATVNYNVVSNCNIAPEFFVDVDITNLGSAFSTTISDNQGSPSQFAFSTGVYQFGPYPNGTSVIFTVTNDQDATCVNTSPARTQASCPPANDNCIGATSLTVNSDLLCTNVVASTIAGATASTQSATACGGTEDDDVWFSFVATQTTHRIALTNIVGSTTDLYHSLWTGADCASLTLVPGTCSDPNESTPANLTIGTTYYLRVYSWTATTGQTSTFNVCVGTLPPPPANDDCGGAIALTVNADASCAVVTPGTVASATASTQDATSCTGTEDDDVWYSFVATNTSHRISLLNVAGSVTDLNHSLWTGADCASLTLVPGTCSDPNVSNPAGLTIGTTYYLRVYTSTATAGQSTTFNVCVGAIPPPPANDACANPTVLTPATDFASGLTNATNVSATLSTQTPTPTCGNFNFATVGKDVWYSVTVPNSGSITIETKGNGGITDSVLQVYSGVCGSLVAVECDDDDGDGNFSLISLTGRTAGEVLLVRAFGYNGSEGTFDIAAYDASLATDTFDNANFKAYPNPVKNTLNLSYNKEITSVSIFNLMGQQVVTKYVNANNSQVDMSSLPTGTYMVKVISDNQVKTLKVIKE